MFRSDKPFIIFVIVLAILAAFPLSPPQAFKMDEARDPFFENFPLAVEGWTGKDAELDARTYEILETRNVLSRNYVNADGKSVHLLLVGSHKDRRVAHPPEVCYVSSNFDIVNAKEGRITVKGEPLSVREFVARDKKDPKRFEKVLYFYKVGSRLTTNYYAQQLFFAWDRLTRRESQILLIRLAGPDREIFESFLDQVLPLLDGNVTTQLPGMS